VVTQERLRAYAGELQKLSDMVLEIAQLRDAVQRAQERRGIADCANSPVSKGNRPSRPPKADSPVRASAGGSPPRTVQATRN
jgi:hypothetical protein